MKKKSKNLVIYILFVLITSCNSINGDKFVYIGHGPDTSGYKLYYDKTKKMFMFIDKRNGCFQKDDTGTCFAMTLKQAREFRNKTLSKMIEIDIKLAQDDHGNHAVSQLNKAGVTAINKNIDVKGIYATPIRQIVVDRKQQYHLIRKPYEIEANLVAMVTKDSNGKSKIRVAYTVHFPELHKAYNSKLRPFIIDPEYLYTHMTLDAVHEAHSIQDDVFKEQSQVRKEIDDYLKNVVDGGCNKKVNVSKSVASLNKEILTLNNAKTINENKIIRNTV